MSEAAASPAPAPAEVTPVEEVGHKVFVGNLSFATKEEELKELFGKHGSLLKAQIIHRGPRSLGYGFVTFSEESAAKAAIAALDKSEINSRQINVEIAKPPEKLKPTVSGEEGAADKAVNGAAKRGRGGKGRGRGRGGRSRRPGPRADGEIDSAEPAADASATEAAKTEGEGEAEKPKKPKKKKAKKPKAAPEATTTEGAPKAEGEEKPKPKKPAQKGPPTGEPSATGLFVANLPFNIDDAGLTQIFTSATPPFDVVSSKIVLRRGGRANGKSKGFGFVELKDSEQQARALTQLDGTTVGDRPIQIKIAVNQEEKKEGEAEGETKEDAKAEPAATIVAS